MRPQLNGRAVRAVSAMGVVMLTAGAFDSAAHSAVVPSHGKRATRGRHAARRHRERSRPRTHTHTPVRLHARLLHTDVLVGQDVALVGSIQPVRAGRRIGVQERRGAHWVDVARGVTDRAGNFSARVWPAQLGSVRLRVRLDEASGTASAQAGGVATVYHAVFASWYGPGGTTACGEALGAGTLGVANRTLPCGTPVTLRYNGRTLRVPVIDRGPFVAGRDYDLTYATKIALGMGDVSLIWASA